MEKVISASMTVVSDSLSPRPVNNSSAATPVTISGVTSGSSVIAPITRPRRDRIRSRPSASIVPSTSEPMAATRAMPRLAARDSIRAALLKKSTYHLVLNPVNAESDLRVVEAEQRDREDRQVEPGEEQDGDRDGERRFAFQSLRARAITAPGTSTTSRAGRRPSAR